MFEFLITYFAPELSRKKYSWEFDGSKLRQCEGSTNSADISLRYLHYGRNVGL